MYVVLPKMVNDISEEMDNNFFLDIFVVLWKALTCVDHTILFLKNFLDKGHRTPMAY